MPYPAIQLVPTHVAKTNPIAAYPIVDCRKYTWMRTGEDKIELFLDEDGTQTLTLDNLQIRVGYETQNHLVVSFGVQPQKMMPNAGVLVLAKDKCLMTHSKFVSWKATGSDYTHTLNSSGGWGWWLTVKTGGKWLRTKADAFHICYTTYKKDGTWDMESVYDEDEVDFDSRTIVDDKTILYNGLVMVLDTDGEVFTRIVTSKSWRSKEPFVFEPYVPDAISDLKDVSY